MIVPLLLAAAASTDWIAAAGGRAETDAQGRIAVVNLRASWITDSDLLALAKMPALEKLDLSRTRISDQGLSYLRTATALRVVDLAYAEKIGDPAHSVIKYWTKLERLSLRGTVVADETAAAAAKLPALEVLDIADTIVGDVGMEALTLAPRLHTLAMGNIRISELGYQSLRQMTTLEHLDLGGRRPGGAGNLSERALEAISSLEGLKTLRLGHLRFAAKNFALLGKLEKLERLDLVSCPGVDDAAIPLIASWKSLRRVDLHGTKVTAEAVAKLRAERPDLSIEWE